MTTTGRFSRGLEQTAANPANWPEGLFADGLARPGAGPLVGGRFSRGLEADPTAPERIGSFSDGVAGRFEPLPWVGRRSHEPVRMRRSSAAPAAADTRDERAGARREARPAAAARTVGP